MSQADAVHSTTAAETLTEYAAPSPKSLRKRLSAAKQRNLVEMAIERLVELLDEIDPDPDFEEHGQPTTAPFPSVDMMARCAVSRTASKPTRTRLIGK